MSVQYRDVTLRDGLQLAGKNLSTERKVALVRQLFDLGVEHVEVGFDGPARPRAHHGRHARCCRRADPGRA